MPPRSTHGLPPLVGPTLRLLVLGSIPGRLSLERQEYYATPRNRFWTLMSDLLGVPRGAPYAARVAALHARGVGDWDVLAECVRPGSLDASIVPGTEAPNDFRALVEAHPELRAIVLNGRAAAKAFHRHVVQAGVIGTDVSLLELPSTSPANAGVRYPTLLERWSALLAHVDPVSSPS